MNQYLIIFKSLVPKSKSKEYELVKNLFQSTPIRVSIIQNCKYTEIAFMFQNSGSQSVSYTLIYFIQDNKSKELSYAGMINSTDETDPSFVKAS